MKCIFLGYMSLNIAQKQLGSFLVLEAVLLNVT